METLQDLNFPILNLLSLYRTQRYSQPLSRAEPTYRIVKIKDEFDLLDELHHNIQSLSLY